MGEFNEFSLDIRREGAENNTQAVAGTYGAVCTFSYMYCYDISLAICTDIASAIASCFATCSCECPANTEGAGVMCSGSTVK